MVRKVINSLPNLQGLDTDFDLLNTVLAVQFSSVGKALFASLPNSSSIVPSSGSSGDTASAGSSRTVGPSVIYQRAMEDENLKPKQAILD